MIALYIISAIFLIIFAILMFWVKITVKFKEDLEYSVKIGPIYLDLDKEDDKEDKKQKNKSSITEKSTNEEGLQKTNKKKLTEGFSTQELYDAVFDILGILKDFLSKYSNTLHLYSSKFYVKIATGDAASTALGCAAIKSAASILFSFVDTYAIIDKGSEKNVNIIPDFTSNTSVCDIELIFRTRLGSILRTLITLFYRYIKKTIEREISRTEKGNLS